MAREKGTFHNPANYEPLIAAPFDARQLVETKADLIAANTWQQANGEIWIYSGMIVAVAADIEKSNNGIYLLLDAINYFKIESWKKMSDETDIFALRLELEELQKEIDNIEISGKGSLDVQLDFITDLPEVGDINTTYYIKENSSIQRWDEIAQAYLSFGGVGETPELDINLIYGGNANGTN